MTNLGYEIDNHYDSNGAGFVRNVKFLDVEGRVYAPISRNGESLLIDVGGSDREVPTSQHLTDLLHSLD
jgi:hypothetical protein